jgi:hypothetical protein
MLLPSVQPTVLASEVMVLSSWSTPQLSLPFLLKETPMSATDPTVELSDIIDRVVTGRLPTMAADWAKSAMDTAEDILATIDDMEANGVEAPTIAQAEALANIYDAACRWLNIPHIEV